MKPNYTWVITQDFIDDEEQGTMGPYNAVLSQGEVIAHKDRQAFQMFDDDLVKYYEGFIVMFNDYPQGFEPLDDFGMPSAGCTEIRYINKETGRFETL